MFLRKYLCFFLLFFVFFPIATLHSSENSRISSKDDLELLLQIAPPNSLERTLLRDVFHILQARLLMESHNFSLARNHWYEALKISKKEIAKIAFEGWVKSFENLNKGLKNSIALKDKISSEAKKLKISLLLQRSEVSLRVPIDQMIEEILRNTFFKSDISYSLNAVRPPLQKGIPENDVLLENVSQDFCKERNEFSSGWKDWINSISESLQLYFTALVEACKGRDDLAILKFDSLYKKFSYNEKTHAYAINSLDHLIKLLRKNSAKKEAAELYLTLIKFWETFHLEPRMMGLNESEFYLRQIDDGLWAARYQSLIGNYDETNNLVDFSLRKIKTLESEPFINNKNFYKELMSFKAESYHTKAFRLAVDQKNYSLAFEFGQKALQTPLLTEEWYDRLMWGQGFYKYLDGDLVTASSLWEELLQKSRDQSVKERVYFWLSRIHSLLKNEKLTDFYALELESHFPLGFYHVVGKSLGGLKDEDRWAVPFKTGKWLKEKIKQAAPFDLSNFVAFKELGRELVRTELFIEGGLKEWASLSGQSLYFLAKRDLRRKKTTLETYLYLSRILYSSGNFDKSMKFVAEMSTLDSDFWNNRPEELLLFFPQPPWFLSQSNVSHDDLSQELALSIARQESGFSARALSPSGAHGLMQLMPSTAKKLSEEMNLPLEDPLAFHLSNPEVNIRLGGFYLKKLGAQFNHFFPAVSGAYNAGEFAVDSWLKRRQHRDILTWIELIPFGETREYVKNTWRNFKIYQFIGVDRDRVVFNGSRGYAKKFFKEKF